MKNFSFLLAAMLVLAALPATAQTEVAATDSGIERIDEDRVRVGAIVVNKKKRRFSIDGKVIRHEAPLEFLIIAKDGQKAYESLIEVEASAFHFRLACLLIGLDDANARVPRYHFDPEPAVGDPVALWVTWEQDGKTRRVRADQLLSDAGKPVPSSAWVFTGSSKMDDTRYFADMDGTLVGVVHDPASVIEHVKGLGLGSYGDVAASDTAPPIGTPVNLIVENISTK